MQKNQMLQSHTILARRYDSMARAIMAQVNGKMSDEERHAMNELDDQALEHRRKAMYGGDVFITGMTAQ